MSTLLALDTSTGSTGVALFCDGAVTASYVTTGAQNHSKLLFNAIDLVLSSSGKTKADLDCIGVTVGPGAFTGLRVGIATAKGLAFALGLPVVGVSSLTALAWSALPFSGVIVPAFDAKKQKIYASALDSNLEPLVDEAAHSPYDFVGLLKDLNRPCLFIGTGVAPYSQLFSTALGDNFNFVSHHRQHIDPAAIAVLSAALFDSGKATTPALLAANYHRLSEAEEKKALRV